MINANITQAIPFFMVTNMASSLVFYVEKLGFTIKDQWEPKGSIEWCLLQLGNAAIMLQEYRESPPAGKLGEGVSVYFICEDALEEYQHIISNGLPVTEPFVGNGMWVVGLTDPDGYSVLFESATDVPEGTTLSDWEKSKRAN